MKVELGYTNSRTSIRFGFLRCHKHQKYISHSCDKFSDQRIETELLFADLINRMSFIWTFPSLLIEREIL